MTQVPNRSYRLRELAAELGLNHRGDDSARISGVGTLSRAGPNDASFLANPAYRDELEHTRAAVVVMTAKAAESYAGNALISANPYADWARLIEHLSPPPPHQPGIHASAVVADTAGIAESASIGPQASIGAGARIGERVRIGPGCVIDDEVVIGDDSLVVARVYIGGRARLGQRVIVHPGVVIGADGFGLAMDRGQWRKVPQVGSVRIGDDCEIGANTTIDRGAIDDTVLDDDVRIDNQVQIAHNVTIGAHTAIAGCVGIAGSTRIGRYCMIAGASGIGGHLDICDSVIITAMSTVLDSIDQPGEYGSGIPARPHGRWKRLLVRLGQLDDWARRLKRIEQLNKNNGSAKP
ncbi:MAG: UDP-3-O-(3-hydroxymyristoyl)glucosamine N-acyltransferase [Wenzhouxiangella sp.]|nr:MAG: UDP-3-O-(3-hydroxymyristoyl)glucosamine N-acyltransferase [Wenzhouxiangella sp.]